MTAAITHHFDHPVCDDLIPTALAIVDAVRCDDVPRFLDELDAAKRAGGPGWVAALIVVLASLVPEDRSVTQLTEWMREAS